VRGTAETTGAITIVNALPTGVGAAIGVDLRVRAEVELHPAGSHGKWDLDVPEPARTPLVIGSLTEALNRFAPGSSGTGIVRLHSQIPPSQGLKSSSAVSSAVILAVARATDAPFEALDVARLSAAVSRDVGVSATGALDDALAGLSSGVVVTDNHAEQVVAQYPIPPELEVAVYLPAGTHPPAPDLWPRFRAEAESGRSAGDLARRGAWAEAIRTNTELVERVVGYDYSELRERLRNHGAIACGVSGLGPALAAIGPRERVPELLEAFPSHSGARHRLAFTSPSSGDSPEVA
jgi:shikimate kinase